MPTVYVFGGRTGATEAVDLVQHYLPWGFGTEDIPPWSDDFGFQSTCNQTDVWIPWFSVPDQDQFPGDNENFDPEIENRGGDEDGRLPDLPEPLYGLMATKVQSGVDTPAPEYPNGPFTAIFLLGGIDDSGFVRKEFYSWNPATPQEDDENPMVRMPDMPTERAYGKAIFIPGNELKIAVVGGYDNNGVPLNTIDVFTFDSIYSVGGGSWETFGGTFAEALVACGAGYSDFGEPSENWILTFGGWTGAEYSYNMFSARLGSSGDQVLNETVAVVPRAYSGSAQTGAAALSALRLENMLGPIDYNRYYIIGGVDENGIESIVETVSLP